MPKTFEPGLNADQLKIDKTRKFVVVSPDFTYFPVGTKLKIVADDKSDWPIFKPVDSSTYSEHSCYWNWLAYADGPEMENVVQKIKDFALSKEARTLRANGMEDRCGRPTQTARDMVLSEMVEERWASRRAEVAKALAEIEKESE